MSDDNLLVQFDLNEVSDTNGYNTFDISATSGATFGVLFSANQAATTDVELLVDISISSTSTTAVGLISEGAQYANHVTSTDYNAVSYFRTF